MAHTPVTPIPEVELHARNYHAFMLVVKWFAIHLASLMVLLVVWFCTTAGFATALISAVVVFAALVTAMRHGLAHSTEDETLQRLR